MQYAKFATIFLVLTMVMILGSEDAQAEALKKTGTIINPITDVAWDAIFPIRIGGYTIKGSGSEPRNATDDDGLDTPICTCGSAGNGFYLGLDVMFNEPVSIIESRKTPWYSVTLGAQLSDAQKMTPNAGGIRTGGIDTDHVKSMGFANTTWMGFPFLSVLGLFTDVKCISKGTVNLMYMSEIIQDDNDGVFNSILGADAFLFANPVAILSCVPNDGIVSQITTPYDFDFWCSWGTVYPLTNHKSTPNYSTANAAIAAKMIFKRHRELLQYDHTIDRCQPTVMPIWRKSAYRLQIARPVRGSQTFPIGRSEVLWASMKNPPYGSKGNPGDEFAFVLFQKKRCCEKVYP